MVPVATVVGAPKLLLSECTVPKVSLVATLFKVATLREPKVLPTVG